VEPAPPAATAADVSQPVAVPIALATASDAPQAGGRPAITVPAGQRLKTQRGVKVRIVCPDACNVVLAGSVKAGAKRLRLVKLTRSLGSGASATVTLRIDGRDLKLLRKAKGNAQAAISASATVGAQTAAQTVAGALKS
jgi:hypothetical protein